MKMAACGANGPAYGAFLTHLDTLKTAVTDPAWLATALYSRGLIDRLAFQRAGLATLAPLERCQELLSALDGKISANEAAFDTFLELISNNPVMEDVRSRLIETREVLTVVDDEEVKEKERKEEDEENESVEVTHEQEASPRETTEDSGPDTSVSSSSSSSAVSRRGSSYSEHAKESFREWKANIAEFVEKTTMSDVAEVLEEEKVLDRLKDAILDFL